MKVSFCMPVYKKEAYLREAIDSVLGQTYKNIELIIVDDATPKAHGIKEIVDYFLAQSKRIKYYRNPVNMGVAFSRNFANMKATGEIICVQDPDDLSLMTRAEVVKTYFKKHRNVDIMYGACHAINEVGKNLGVIPAHDFNVNRLRTENFIAHPTVAYRKTIGVKYRNGVRYIDDWYLYLDCFAGGKVFGWVQSPLSIYRAVKDGLTFGGGYSNRKKELAKTKLRKEFETIEEDISDKISGSKEQMIRLRAIAKNVPEGSTVLELGCNAGAVSLYLKKKKRCSAEGVEWARNLVNICKDKGLKTTCADIRKYRNIHKYDRIILGDVLEHFKKDDVQKILNNAASMLKHDGMIVITIPYKYGVYSTKYINAHVADYGDFDIQKMLPDFTMKCKPIIIKGVAMPYWLLITAVR